jgi:putative ABC transport system permease protein
MTRYLRILTLRLRSLWSGTALDRELDEELRYHVDRQTDEHVARGMAREDARTAALRAIGGVEGRKEQMRDARGISMIENLLRDLRLAARQLRKQPGFTFTAILSLALGIGANTAIFQLLNALSLRTLPVRAPHELVEMRLEGDGRSGRHTGRNRQISQPQYEALLPRQQAFSSFIAFGDTRFNLSRTGEVRYVDGLWVSGNFFDTLGVTPAIGRLIGPADDVKGCGQIAVISYALWQSQFGGRADVIGQTLPGAGAGMTIVGVTAPGFWGVEVGRQFGVAAPICASGNTRRDHWWLAAMGRLKPGWTREQARAQLQGILPDVQRDAMPEYRSDWQAGYLKMTVDLVDASSGVSPLRRTYQRPLWILMAVAGLVLLLAAVNLANLSLARATARQQEFAVRLAIGGTRGRVLQQVLTESALLAALGSIAAVGVAMAASRAIPPLMSTAVDRIHLDLSPDWRVFAFTMAVGIATSLIVGLAPAIRLSGVSIARTERGSAGNAGARTRRVLVGAQVAITIVLLFGGLLFLRTFRNLSTQDLGIGERGVVVATVFFREAAQPAARRADAYRDLDARLQAMPGVVRMAETYTAPFAGSMSNTEIVVDQSVMGDAWVNRVSPGYFETIGTKLIAGRDFDERDGHGAGRVAIVTKSFSEVYLKGAGVGARYTEPDDFDSKAPTQYEVIGIVADQKYMDLRETQPKTMFLPSAQQPDPPSLTRRYVVRASTAPAQTIGAITQTVGMFDPTATIRFALLDTQISEAMLQERLMARLSGIFGLVALLLAIVGLYGVVSYGVASRRAEIGVRVALGASRSRILSMVMGDIGRVMIAGVLAGSALALAAGRGINSMLFGLEGSDVMTLLTAAGVLIACGLLSAAWPAKRATAIDPVTVLRES